MRGEPKSKHALVQKRSEIKQKKQGFFKLKVRSDIKTENEQKLLRI